jgi:hypothetical protein
MVHSSLQAFAERLRTKGRIGKQDVALLQRVLLPDGIMSRHEAEFLVALDREIAGAHAAWSAYLIGSLVDYAVWGARPTGTIDRETGAWLAALLTGAGSSPLAGRILAEIVREADRVDAALLAHLPPAGPAWTALAA